MFVSSCVSKTGDYQCVCLLYILFDIQRKIFYSMTVKLTEKSEFSPAATYFNWPENLARRWEHMGLPVLLRTAWQEGFVSGMGGWGRGGLSQKYPHPPTPTAEGDICRESRAHSSVLGLCCDLLYHHCTMHMPYFAFTQPSFRSRSQTCQFLKSGGRTLTSVQPYTK